MSPIGSLWGDIFQRQTKVVSVSTQHPAYLTLKQILSVAALNDQEIVLPVPEFKFLNKPEDFVAKFAYGKIPAFEDSEGWKLVEGTSIARYRKWVLLRLPAVRTSSS